MRRLSRDVEGDNKIVGGNEVVPNSIPYQVSLKRLSRGAGHTGSAAGTCRGFCGGVIVSKDHILTAAHCCDVSCSSSLDDRKLHSPAKRLLLGCVFPPGCGAKSCNLGQAFLQGFVHE